MRGFDSWWKTARERTPHLLDLGIDDLIAQGPGGKIPTLVLDGGGGVVDSSDLPLTSLRYPKAATKADYRERFGGSFAGAVGCLEKMQRIGFGWTRWWPKNKWHNFQPEAGRWVLREIKETEE